MTALHCTVPSRCDYYHLGRPQQQHCTHASDRLPHVYRLPPTAYRLSISAPSPVQGKPIPPGPDRRVAENCVALSEPWKTWARFCSSFLSISPYTFSTKLHSWTQGSSERASLFHLSCIFSPWEHASIIKLFCRQLPFCLCFSHFCLIPSTLDRPSEQPKGNHSETRASFSCLVLSSPSIPFLYSTRQYTTWYSLPLDLVVVVVVVAGNCTRHLSTCRSSHGAPAAQEGWP